MNIDNMNYSEFCMFIAENDDVVECVLGYDDWSVVRVDSHFYYYEHEIEGSSDTFFEVKPIALLSYDVNNDISSTDNLHILFDCDMCGEQITDDRIYYWWFKQI